MKRNKIGMSHKVKGSMDFGLIYPVLVQEMEPGDILRVKPEAIVKSAIPPVTALTDKIFWKMESFQCAERLLDDHFVRNMSTTKTGEVKGNFKIWTLDQIERSYGSVSRGYTPLRNHGHKIPRMYKSKGGFSKSVANYYGVWDGKEDWNIPTTRPIFFDSDPTHLKLYENTYSEALPKAYKNNVDSVSGRSAPFFGQGSLLDWLGLEPNGNIGQKDTNDAYFRCAPISMYYMIVNFYKTNPEYEKYIAPYFDYVYTGEDNSEGRETLHRYEMLEDEFGNEFIEPELSGRCVNGLVVDNWSSDYFSNTTRDPQRGIAPTVPVSVTGGLSDFQLKVNAETSGGPQTYLIDGVHPMSNAWALLSSQGGMGYGGTLGADANLDVSGSFTISDLRTALALQHFQEDIQGTFKWTSFLQRVFGISPSDTLSDQPIFKGSAYGVLSSSEVLQTVQTVDGNLGDIGGHLSGYGTGKMITCKASEHSWFMVLMTIKVERNYESGVERQFTRKNFLDMYFPEFVGIGNQAIRADELCAVIGNSSREKNIAFTERYGEMRHKYNRIVGKCRNDNMVLPYTDYTEDSGGYATIRYLRDNGFDVPYLNDFHPYAIGDAYTTTGAYINDGLAIGFSEINQDFLLCTPQLNDIFVDDSEEPFMVVLGFNMDMFRPLPVFTRPGVRYV